MSEKIGKVVMVTSGIRFITQNGKVKGVLTSQHLLLVSGRGGNAADLKINGQSSAQTASDAFNSGEFSRVNDYQNSRGVHVDQKSTNSSGFYRSWVSVYSFGVNMTPRSKPVRIIIGPPQ